MFRSAEAALLQLIVRGRYRFHSHSWARISDEAKDFVRSLMCVDPSKRVTCEEALQHPWLRSVLSTGCPICSRTGLGLT